MFPDHVPSDLSGAPVLVVIAASSGGLAALCAVLAPLPTTFPAAIALVLHRAARGDSDLLSDILTRRTRLAVVRAMDGEALRPATVYVAPADRHLRIDTGRRVSLAPGPLSQHLSSAADPLFASAALAFGKRLIAVILTGRGRDGAVGAIAVRDAGGIVLVQDPETSNARGMPDAAIATGAVHTILPLEQIGERLSALVA